MKNRWFLCDIFCLFLAAVITPVIAVSQPIDCESSFELHLPLIELGLSAVDGRNTELYRESYRRYVEECDGFF